ncbi:PAS domain S-box protein [Aggregicoccus sp. 17bor-14]|uniref:PAS domain-containing sensor histidine kinase n=1 Tax=Myxococcaceae TaxID=31 RepID=UPI00129CEBD0|nr:MULTISPECIES: PAS domain-containing sensor histidine kinase [Myxococcaceae]MBF5045924.1 PAS domain S-box protein [Simulacricoccus sp. 17bor-14]MRI91658.1 PAS domain S-box protein [Aggregicoccus sp. 17bor-14]
MLESTAAKQDQGLGLALSSFLSQQREAVLGEWTARLSGPPRALLQDVAQALYERLSERALHPGSPPESSGELPGPLLERLAEACDSGDLLAHLSQLRALLLRRLEEAGGPLPQDAAALRLGAAFDAELVALQGRFGRARARLGGALEAVVRAGAAPAGPREGLMALVRTLTEGTATVDWAAVHAVRESGVLATVAGAGGVGQLPGAFARQALQERRALEGAGAGCAALPVGTRMQLALPLVQQGQVLGVLQVGSRSAPALPSGVRRLVELAAEASGGLLARLALAERLARQAERAPDDARGDAGRGERGPPADRRGLDARGGAPAGGVAPDASGMHGGSALPGAGAQSGATGAGTGRAEPEDSLRRQQQLLLGLLVNAAPVALWAVDPQGTVLLSEGQALARIGLEPGEAVGRSAFEFARGKPTAQAALRRALQGGSGAYESSQDGRTHFTRYQPVRAPDGTLEQVVLVSVDITERRRAQEDAALLRMLVEQSSDGVIVVDRQGVLRICNQQAERQLGRAVRPLPAARWPEAYDILTPEGERAPLKDFALYRALKGESVRDARCRVRHPDGSVHTLVSDASPIRHPDGSLAGAVLTCRDETEREGLEAGLRESEERFRAVFEGAAIGIAITDMDGCFLRTNPALQRLLGYSDAELRSLRLKDMSTAQDLATERPLFQQLRTGQRETYQVERRYVAKGGEVGWCRLTVSLGHGSDARPRFIIGLVEDLAPHRRAEELERAAEFRERFMGILGHDLRNPLNAIALSGQRLLQQPLPAPQARSVHRITHSAERMGRMVSDLLDFARARLGSGLPIVRRWVDLGELARNAVDELCAAHPDCHAELRTEGDTWGWWDADRMAQVLSNLLGNARQYRAPGTGITLQLRGEGAEVRMAVSNQGGPIPPDLLPHLFDPFRRGSEGPGHAPAHGHNLGLGLFIVKQVVEAHGGSIEVRSSAEEGTAFLVRWPRNPPSHAH